MSAWIARKTLRCSRSNELDTTSGEAIKRPNRSQSVCGVVAVSRALPTVRRRHNSVVAIRVVVGHERERQRYQSRSYLNSPVKRAQYFRDYADNALQGELTRAKGVIGDRLQAAG